jgi:hypothetical protein
VAAAVLAKRPQSSPSSVAKMRGTGSLGRSQPDGAARWIWQSVAAAGRKIDNLQNIFALIGGAEWKVAVALAG